MVKLTCRRKNIVFDCSVLHVASRTSLLALPLNGSFQKVPFQNRSSDALCNLQETTIHEHSADETPANIDHVGAFQIQAEIQQNIEHHSID